MANSQDKKDNCNNKDVKKKDQVNGKDNNRKNEEVMLLVQMFDYEVAAR